MNLSAPSFLAATVRPLVRSARLGALFAAAALLSGPMAGTLRANESMVIPDLADLKMIKVEAGTFLLGRPLGISERDESPETKVTISKPFWLGETELTVAQFRKFADATGYKTEPEKTGAGIMIQIFPKDQPDYEQRPGTSWRNPSVPTSDRHPVVGVAWVDAQAYCAWLTKREKDAGRLPAGYIYSLPTEAQWEYACKAGTGENESAPHSDEVDWHRGNSGRMAHPVAQLKPNPWGFYDMIGNVWEWCQDCYGPYPGGEVTDYYGKEPADLSKAVRNVRGNSFSGLGQNGTNLTNRWGNIPNREYRTPCGFRIALVPERK